MSPTRLLFSLRTWFLIGLLIFMIALAGSLFVSRESYTQMLYQQQQHTAKLRLQQAVNSALAQQQLWTLSAAVALQHAYVNPENSAYATELPFQQQLRLSSRLLSANNSAFLPFAAALYSSSDELLETSDDFIHEIQQQCHDMPMSGYTALPDVVRVQASLCTLNQRLIHQLTITFRNAENPVTLRLQSDAGAALQSIQETLNSKIRLITFSGDRIYQSRNWSENASDQNTRQLQAMVSHTLQNNQLEPVAVIQAVPPETLPTPILARIEQLLHQKLAIILIALLASMILMFLLLLFSIRRTTQALGTDLDGEHQTIDPKLALLELQPLITSYNRMADGFNQAAEKQESALKQLRQEKDFIDKTLQSIGSSVMVLNSRLIIQLANPTAEYLFDTTEEDLKGYKLDEVGEFYINRSATHIADLEKLLRQPEHTHNLFFSQNQQQLELEMTVSPMLDEESDDLGYVIIFKDVTEARRLKRKLTYESRHDSLTGFLNRTGFEKRFEMLVSDSENTNEHVIAYLDLDRFSVVNERFGEVAGDELIRKMAEIIRDNIRKSDFIARLGADEFGIIFPFAETPKVANTLNDLLLYIEHRGFDWNDQHLPITASAAMMTFGYREDDYSDKISKLNTACAQAKESHGNRFYIIENNDQLSLYQPNKTGWMSGISSNLDESQFILFAQPIISLNQAEERLHYEVLLRYRDQHGNIVPLNELLPSAERSQQIERIDRWVTTQVVNWLLLNRAQKDQVLFTINLSGHSIGSLGFHEFLQNMLNSELLDNSCLCFEINETSAIRNIEKTQAFIRTIKDLGAQFSIDDFSSGLSSFSYLKQFPVDFLKIHQEFILDIAENNRSYEFVKAITQVGHSLGMKVVAEFSESPNMFHKLREAGIDYLQGFSIGMPEPLDQIDLGIKGKPES